MLLDGENVFTMSPGRLRAVRWTEAAIVFQGAMHALNPVWKVKHQIAEAIQLHDPIGDKATQARVGELLEQVGLPGRRADAYPHQLSGGQRQRVMIAMALACSPRLLIADEPTTALDVMVQAQVLALLEQLQEDLGLAMVFITHDLSVLTSCCQRLAIMYAGRVVEEGPSHTVFAAPAAPVHEGARRGVPDHRRHALPARPRSAWPATRPIPGSCHPGCPFVPRCSDAIDECSDAEPELLPAGPMRARRVHPRRGHLVTASGRRPDHRGQRPPRHVRGQGRRDATRRRPARSTASTSRSSRARSSRSSASPAAARRRWRAPCSGSSCPASGEIRFQGTPLPRSTKALRKYRRNVQIVFQDPTGALNPRQTIYESVAEGLRIHKVEGNEKDLVADALARSGLRPPERFFQRYPHEISGGQRQRVVIAGAIALDPWLIVADEPVASLDASVRGEILRLMLGLVQETEVAMLVVTHDLGLAWNIADRIAVMYLGRIVEIGTTEEVLDDPKHPVHARAAERGARDRAHGARDPPGRAARPDQDPGRLPLPPALPGGRVRPGRRARASSSCARPWTRARRRPHRSRRRPATPPS